MKNYKLLEHTADVRIAASGDNLEALFAAALEGLCEVMNHVKSEEPAIVVEYGIEIHSIDTTALLIDFLSDSLTLMQTDNCLLRSIKFDYINQTSLKGTLTGISISGFLTDVKAVTYHEAEVISNSGFFESMVVLDI